MADGPTEKETRLLRGRSYIPGVALIVLALLMSGGVAWHRNPGSCAVCHEPMKRYVDSYQSGDRTLMVTAHAAGRTLLVCLDCHETEFKKDVARGVNWVTGNYKHPLEPREFGTREFCLKSGCHDEASIIKATQNYGGANSYNQHDPHHGKLQCYCCHSAHGKSVFMCNRCHNLKLPAGWVTPSMAGKMTNPYATGRAHSRN